MSNLIITIKENMPKVYQSGYDKALRDNPPGASPEELKAKYDEGYTAANNEAIKEISELISLQEEYIALGIKSINFKVIDSYTYEEVSFIAKETDTWADIIAADLNGIASKVGLQIEISDYGYLLGVDRSAYVVISGTNIYCKATDTLVDGAIYDYTAMPPEGMEWSLRRNV